MANYAAETLKIKSLYVVDDTGAYGEGIANSFEAQAKTKGINVLGHDKLNPKESDYTTILTKIKDGTHGFEPRKATARQPARSKMSGPGL